jgi:ATP-dependent DNA helicase RecG
MKYPEKESSTVEWKREIPKNDQIIKTIIGFCNHHGGKIVIGVTNTGNIVGIASKKIEKALENLEKMIYEACYPSIIPRIYTQRFGEKSILIIEVSSGMNKPYYRKSKGLDGGCYVRLGRSTMKATPDIIEELRWQANSIDFETLPNHRATKKDLDEKKIQFFLDHRKNDAKSIITDPVLRAYHLLVLEHSKFFPTQAAILLFGKNTQYFLSEARIICSHFQGVSGRDVIAKVDCEGTLFDQFKQAYAFITSRLYTSFKIRKPKRYEKLEIPEVAIREALLNAIVHRNYFIKAPIKVAIYDNRLEIFSPGSFPGPLDQNNLKSGITYLRNPIICKIFREIGYVEKLGSGLITIFKSYEKENLEDPQIIEGENYVKAILPRFKKKKFKEKQDELTKLFAFSDEISIEDVQKILGVSRATASRKVNQWLKKGVVKRFGKTRAIRYRKK